MKIVFDTNVLARGHKRSRGPARQLLVHLETNKDTILISDYILGELRRLGYPRMIRQSNLTPDDIEKYLSDLGSICRLVVPSDVPETLLRDPTDAPVLGTALAGRADVLCTRDADFFEEKVERFCTSNGIRLLTDTQLLDRIKI